MTAERSMTAFVINLVGPMLALTGAGLLYLGRKKLDVISVALLPALVLVWAAAIHSWVAGYAF